MTILESDVKHKKKYSLKMICFWILVTRSFHFADTEKFVYQTIGETLVEYDVTTNNSYSVFDVTDDPVSFL